MFPRPYFPKGMLLDWSLGSNPVLYLMNNFVPFSPVDESSMLGYLPWKNSILLVGDVNCTILIYQPM